MKDKLNLRVFTKNRSIQWRKMIKWQLFKYHLKQRVCIDWVDKPQNYKGMYGILQLLQGSHLNNFSLKTLKLCWVAFLSKKFQWKCLDFQSSQSNQYKKLVPVLSHFCNGLLLLNFFKAFSRSGFSSFLFQEHFEKVRKQLQHRLRLSRCLPTFFPIFIYKKK